MLFALGSTAISGLKSWPHTFSSPPSAGEITEEEAGREDFVGGLLRVNL